MRRISILFLLCVSVTAVLASAVGAATTSARTTAASGDDPVLFGDQTVESTQDSNRAGVAQAWPLSTSTNGTAASISIYVDSANTATQLIVGLYADNDGSPGSLLASGSLSQPTTGAWNTISIASTAVSSGRTYWLALLGAGGTPYFRDRSYASCNSQGSAQSNLSSLPSTWSNGPVWGSCPVSAYVNGYLATTTAAPSDTALPAISGTATQGQALSTSNGSWSGSPSSYGYQWRQCDSSGSNCTNISGATSSSYTLASGDVGHTMRAVVTATGAGGSASATSAQTTTVTASGGSCASSTPNVPDGPDPRGGCFPGPSNTGVPAGTVLTTYTGPCRITTDNTVIDSKTINCNPLRIAASNVQITRSLVNGEVSIDSYPSPYSFTISDSEVVADSTTTGVNNGATGIGKSNFTAIRDNVHGGIRSIWCEFNCTEKDDWLHGQLTDPTGAAHESATRMGENSLITHNSMVCDARNVPPAAGCSADLTGYGDFEVIESDTISNNLFIATEGGTCAYGGSTPNKPYSNGVHDIVFQNNIFRRGPGNQGAGPLGHCGYWFGISDFDPNAPGNQWINNRWDDGTLMPSDG